jgi:hypothetical protein
MQNKPFPYASMLGPNGLHFRNGSRPLPCVAEKTLSNFCAVNVVSHTPYTWLNLLAHHLTCAAASIATAISTAFLQSSAASDSKRFWIAEEFRPPTN